MSCVESRVKVTMEGVAGTFRWAGTKTRDRHILAVLAVLSGCLLAAWLIHRRPWLIHPWLIH